MPRSLHQSASIDEDDVEDFLESMFKVSSFSLILTCNNRELKLDVYGSRQTAKITSDFLSSPKSHKKRKMSPTIHRKYKYFHSTIQTAEETDGQKFQFCRLPQRHAKSL